MCEICGGPHFTCLCPDYSRPSAPTCVTNSFMHAQTYYSQECSTSQKLGRLSRIEGLLTELVSNNVSYDPQPRDSGKLSRIEDLLTQLVSNDVSAQKRLAEQEILVQQNQLMLENSYKAVEESKRCLEEVQRQRLQQESGNDLCPYPKFNTFYDDSDEIMHTQPTPCLPGNDNSNSTYSFDSYDILNESQDNLHLSCEDEISQESHVQPETTMDVSVAPPVCQVELVERKGRSVVDYSLSKEEIDAQLKEYMRGKLEEYNQMMQAGDDPISPDLETKMDAEVPPSGNVNVIYPVDSDSDDDLDEAKWAEYRESLVRDVVPEEEVELGDSLGLMFGTNEDELEVHLSEEDELLDLELDSLPDYSDLGVIDTEGDLTYLDSLLEDEPVEMIDPTTYANTKCGDHQVSVVIEEEHHSRPVKHFEDKAILSLPKSWDKANESKRNDRGRVKDECFYKPRKIDVTTVKIRYLKCGPTKWTHKAQQGPLKIFGSSEAQIDNLTSNK
ncbi:hypothetical protein QVD17_21036 [Tagetes erecta]|uniref:Uncharacterized protein n=1 Tax=Tagetes erecta TaxID=13708 RepID=A0AAD8KR07_TARER|nr:hypothetical protein QVD17_21036 [Tagetes erecta]